MNILNYRSSLLLSLFILMVFTGTASGQSTANYAFSTVTNGSLENMSSGTTDIFATGIFRDDIASSVIDIGFTFFFMGQPYTQFSINSNGLMRLGSTAISGTQYVHTAGAAILGPISNDNSLQSTGKAHYKVTGSAPSRVLVVEWDKLRIPYSNQTTETYCTFQVHLSEETGSIEYRYGTMYNSGVSENRGIFISSGNIPGQVGSIKNITTVPVYDTSEPGVWLSNFGYAAMTNLNSASDGNRRVFKFEPGTATAPTNLSFTSVGIFGMTLNWTDSPNELRYAISRSTDGTHYTLVTSLNAGTTTYAATDLNPGTTYYWRVYALREGNLGTPLAGSASTASGTISGTKKIGPNPGDDYPTITATITAIRSAGLAGATILELQTGYSGTETLPIALSNLYGSAANTLTIRPATGVTALTISGSNATAIFDFNGSQYITIDGRPGGTGNARELTISNTSTSGVTVRLINDASNNTMRNCTFQGATTSVTNGVVFFSTGITTGNDNNTLMNCVIRDRSDAAGVPYFLMYSAGSSAAVTNTGNTISGNELFNFIFTGIQITSTGNENWTITGNEIYQASARTTAQAGIEFSSLGTNTISQNTIRSLNTNNGIYGIWLGDARNTTVSRNRIKIVDVSGSTSTWTGIQFAGESGTAVNVTLVNNQVTLIPLTATSMTIRGIHDNAYLGNTLNVSYNSVYISGTATGTSTWAYLRRMGSSTTGTLKNNIFFNNRTGGSVNHFALGDQSNGNGTFTVSNNLYVGTGIISANFMERGTSGIAESFSAWKTAKSDLASYASIASSLSAVNLFSAAATGDLNITPGNTECWSVNGKGIALTGNADDYSATGVRSASAGTSSDIGSDEFIPTGAAVNAPTATASGLPAVSTTTSYTVTANQVGSIVWGAGGTVPTSLTFRYYSGSQAPSVAPGDRAYLYYDISQAGGSGYTFDITLWYDEGQLNGIAEADLRPARSTDGGNTWIPYLTTGTGPGQYQINTTANTITIYGLTEFFLFTLTSQSNPLPVELSSFTSSVSGQSVNLSWSTATEVDNYGFEVQKSENQSDWSTIGFVHGSGNSNSNKQYAYTDQQAGTGTIYYRLKQIDNAGTFKVYDPISVEVEIPKDFTLSQNYPNPFNPATTINYTLPTAGSITLQVYSMNGELVQTLIQGYQAAGSYSVSFDATRLASGTYAYRLITTGADGQTQSALKKMLLIK